MNNIPKAFDNIAGFKKIKKKKNTNKNNNIIIKFFFIFILLSYLWFEIF